MHLHTNLNSQINEIILIKETPDMGVQMLNHS